MGRALLSNFSKIAIRSVAKRFILKKPPTSIITWNETQVLIKVEKEVRN